MWKGVLRKPSVPGSKVPTGADFSQFQLESRTKCGHRSIGGGEGTKKRSLSREPVFLGGRLEKVPPLVIFYTTEEALLIVRPG